MSDNSEMLIKALKDISFMRPLGPCRSKLVERMERVAINALDAYAALPASKEAEAVGLGRIAIAIESARSKAAVFADTHTTFAEIEDELRSASALLGPKSFINDTVVFAHPPTDAGVSEAMVERAARAICLSQGEDPDTLDRMRYCDANDNPMPLWNWYAEQARAALSTAIPAGVEDREVAKTDALIEARDCMSRAADIMENDSRIVDAAYLRRAADLCRAAIAKAVQP